MQNENSQSLGARSAYIHVPFCRHRCGYCNFSVVAGRDDLVERFLSAIELELRQIADASGKIPAVDTVFVGGGTPTYLSIDALERFLTILHERLDIGPHAEWSIEANPEDICQANLRVMRNHGVNRLSLGVQSFDDAKLGLLERGHSGTQAAEVIRMAAGSFDNLSIDLIFGTPGETVSQWESDLLTAISLPIRHLSTYALTYEKGTSFWSRKQRGALRPADEGDEIAMYDLGRQLLGEAGLQHYEISNFAAERWQCRHNLNYWRGENWYAAGPGAAAFLAGVRSVNHRSPTTYLKRLEAGLSPVAESESISAEQLARESAAFGVRMIEGCELTEIADRTGVDLSRQCAASLARMETQGLIARIGNRIRLTERGIHFADTVACELLGPS